MTEQEDNTPNKEHRLRMIARESENMTSTQIKGTMEEVDFKTDDLTCDEVRDNFEDMAVKGWDEVGMWNDFQTKLDIYVNTPFYDKYGDVITKSNSQMIDMYHEHLKQEVRGLSIVPIPDEKYNEMKTKAQLIDQIKELTKGSEISDSEKLNKILHKIKEAENL